MNLSCSTLSRIFQIMEQKHILSISNGNKQFLTLFFPASSNVLRIFKRVNEVMRSLVDAVYYGQNINRTLSEIPIKVSLCNIFSTNNFK